MRRSPADVPLGAKAPTGTSYNDEDSDGWEHRILSEMHKDVLEAFEKRVREDFKDKEQKRAGPSESARKAERTVKTRGLKKVLEDFERCRQEGMC